MKRLARVLAGLIVAGGAATAASGGATAQVTADVDHFTVTGTITLDEPIGFLGGTSTWRFFSDTCVFESYDGEGDDQDVDPGHFCTVVAAGSITMGPVCSQATLTGSATLYEPDATGYSDEYSVSGLKVAMVNGAWVITGTASEAKSDEMPATEPVTGAGHVTAINPGGCIGALWSIAVAFTLATTM